MPSSRRRPILRRRRRTIRRKPRVSAPVRRYISRRFPRPELKRISSVAMDEVTQDSLSSSFAVTELSQVAQGNTLYGRIGNEVIAKGIHLRGVIHSNIVRSTYVRTFLVGTTDSIDATYATGEWFDTSVTGIGDTALAVTGLNQIYCRLNKNKFKVLFDKTYRLGANQVTDGSNTRTFNIFRKLNKRLKFEGNTYGPGNQNYRYLWVTVVAEGGDDSVGGTVEFSAQTMFYFSDV